MGRIPFDSIYRHGFARVAVCIPFVRLGNPDENATRTIGLARRADEMRATIAIFPELGLSGYSNEDLFHQDALLEAARGALARVVDASRTFAPLVIVGAPLKVALQRQRVGVKGAHQTPRGLGHHQWPGR
jgi:NAD+ synthase (glutamine-hydrolysing)